MNDVYMLRTPEVRAFQLGMDPTPDWGRDLALDIYRNPDLYSCQIGDYIVQYHTGDYTYFTEKRFNKLYKKLKFSDIQGEYYE